MPLNQSFGVKQFFLESTDPDMFKKLKTCSTLFASNFFKGFRILSSTKFPERKVPEELYKL